MAKRKSDKYNPTAIEKKWQEEWQKKKLFSPNLDKSPNPYYNLWMFPYPSGEGLHVGHFFASTGSDIHGRFMRMKGKDVFQPIGYDAFGIHSENYALKVGTHPKDLIEKTTKRYEGQLRQTGHAYDWTRTVNTSHPDYYRWTQWLFVKMFKAGLAYRQKSPVNWCPSCKTVLADEQVIGRECERCSSIVELRKVEQWFFRITDYADRLLENLEKIDWPERIKNAQRNWIGRSEGTEIRFKIDDLRLTIPTFTTRPDTLFGATFLVLSPDSDWIEKVTTKESKQKVTNYIKREKTHTHPRKEREKTGVFTGGYAINPATGEEIPIWIADYVVGGYGSGAIMAVPAHDERDFEFAKKYDLPIRRVIKGGKLPYTGYGEMVDSGDWNGWKTPRDMGKVTSWLEDKGIGKAGVSYHLRDWLISRQRYWGPPIPMIFCERCDKEGKGEREDMPGWYTVPEDQLPVELPYIENYQPKGTGEAPLAQDKEWVKVKCPGCGKTARRETDVSDTFLDSSWYFFRYISTEDESQPWRSERAQKWLPVHMYIGGAEHSVLHLMYARFVTMAFKDWGLIGFEEPFARFYAHGLLIKEGAKMSKSRGNVVVPDEYVKKYGADTLRAYLMFLGPFSQGGDFRDTGVEGMHRFVRRVWDLVIREKDLVLVRKQDSEEVYRVMHQTIKGVTSDMEKLRYNTAIAKLMEYVNFLRSMRERETQRAKGNIRCAEWEETLQTLVLLLAPFTPHMSEELWVEVLGQEFSVHKQDWPKYSPELAREETVEIPVQVNGRLRATIEVDRSEAEEQEAVEERAREVDGAARHLKGKSVKKVIFVPGRLINFVTTPKWPTKEPTN